MPQYRLWHKPYCEKKAWGIECCLHGRWPPSSSGQRCPLDSQAKVTDSDGRPVPEADGKTWHGVHEEMSAGLIDWSEIEKGDLSLDECAALIEERVLGGMMKFFPHFVNMVQQQVWDATGGRVENVTCEQLRSCWKAHLVVDYAYTYLWRKRDFVGEVGDRFFANQ
jgi:hypothetical protein